MDLRIQTETRQSFAKVPYGRHIFSLSDLYGSFDAKGKEKNPGNVTAKIYNMFFVNATRNKSQHRLGFGELKLIK